MNDRRGSADEGLWMVLCVLLLFLLLGAGGFVWIRQRQAQQAMAAEQAAMEAARMHQLEAEMAMERAEVERVRAEAARDEAAAQAAVGASHAAIEESASQLIVPELYLNQDLWQYVESLADAEPNAKVFTLEPESGEIRFGNGERGAIPPIGPVTVQATYGTAGGGTVTVSLPETDLGNSRIRAVLTAEGALQLELMDAAEVVGAAE